MGRRKTRLKWEYCECGCKSYVAQVGDMGFTIFWDLKDSYYLSEGHSPFGYRLSVYKSMKEADEVAYQLVKKQLKEIQKALR